MGRVANKVAFITGAARGQGRSHAVRLAEEGADIVALDLCTQVATVEYEMSTPEDLAETVRMVRKTGRRIIARPGDVRDSAQIESIVQEGLTEFGHIDIVVANAGIGGVGVLWELTDEQWQDMIDINLTGVWRTVKAVVPSMIDAGRGGSIILVSSTGGFIGIPRLGHYSAAKHGVTGLARSFAVELAPHSIRVNSIHPGNVYTPMISSPIGWKVFTGKDDSTAEDFERSMMANNALPVAWAQPHDISNAVVYLASDETRYVTGTQHVIDAGNLMPMKLPHLAN